MKTTITKKLATMLYMSALSTGSFAQGTVSFANGPTTLISYNWYNGYTVDAPAPLPSNAPGSFYFGLLISTSATGPFVFTGVYATNTALSGHLGPNSYTPPVTGWAPGATMFFEVAGWSASQGETWKSGWLVNNVPAYNSSIFFGVGNFGLSNIGSGTAGGGITPPLPVFGGTGVSGFNLYPIGIPEPTGIALSSLGAASLLIFRRRKVIWRTNGKRLISRRGWWT
jgi:hypothetical protein